jgi:hypothetical protein
MTRRGLVRLSIVAAIAVPAFVAAGGASSTSIDWRGLPITRAMEKLGRPGVLTGTAGDPRPHVARGIIAAEKGGSKCEPGV